MEATPIAVLAQQKDQIAVWSQNFPSRATDPGPVSVQGVRFVSYMSPGFPASLFELIADRIGAELTLIDDRSGPAPDEDPFADGTFDLGWICSTSFVDLSLHRPESSVRLTGIGWAPADPQTAGKPVYFGDLIVPADSPADRLSDLAGASIGCNDEVSLSGHHALRFALRDLGFDPATFADLVFTGGHNISIDHVLSGRLDAAIVDSVVLAMRRLSGPLDLRVIDRLGPWPTQPLVARRDLPRPVIEHVRASLLGANDDPAMQRELRNCALLGFVATAEDHYAVVHRAMTPA